MNTYIKIFVKIVMAILFLLCLRRMSYGYYTLIRFAGIVGFAWLAYVDSKRKDKSLMILWIALAMLINPFVKLSLNRSTWHVVDIVLASILFLTVIYDIINDCCHRTKNKENPKNKVPKSSPVNSIPKFNVNIEELAKMTLHGAIGRDALKKAKKI